MADIAAGDLTYTLVKQRKEDSSNKVINLTVAFGNSTLTYPSGGIPLTSSKLGTPNSIISLIVDGPSSADGLIYKYDKANNKIRIYYSAAQSHNHTLFLNNAEVADGATARVNAGTNLLGANTGSDISIAGVADTSGHGGVVTATLAAGALVEVTAASYAPAATTLYVEVTGW